MPLAPGTQLGPYEITAPLGAGGMGEVYRATDTRLGRSVAIKVISPGVSSDPTFRQRFEREGRSISKLSHPHICALFDVGHQDGIDFLVLEYMEGETLEHRLKRSSLRSEEILQYAIELADALDAAHRLGCVHRDIKPSNIMLTQTGARLFDFGLAKFAAHPISSTEPPAEVSTESGRLTDEGRFIGTLQYMAPEQLEGKEADARTDIFALGSVIYEMAAGRPAFTGRSRASLIAAILSSAPLPITSLSPVTPPALSRLVEVSLQKDPNNRWQNARDVKHQLLWIRKDLEEQKAETAGPAGANWLRLGAAVLLGAILSAVILWRSASPGVVHSDLPVRFAIMLRPDESIEAYINGAVALSPDGRLVTYAASRGDERGLYVRSLDSLEPKWLPGTDRATNPFFSPDGHWLGFEAGGALKKISLDGGGPQFIAETPYFAGATWAPDDRIIFTPVFTSGLWRTTLGGGKPQRLTTPEAARGEHAHLWPALLPGGKALLFTIWRGGSADQCEIAVLSLESGEKRVLFQGGYYARYAHSGHILYEHNGNLMAVPFDLQQLKVTGRGVTVMEGVLSDSSASVASFDVSRNGTLVYVPGTENVPSRSLVWTDRSGKIEPVTGVKRPYGSPRISPDQQRLALWTEYSAANVWVYELRRGTLTKIAFGDDDHSTAWSPDGKRVAFESSRSGVHHIYVQSADGTGTEEQLTTGEFDQYLGDWSPDGRSILFTEFRPNTGADLWVVSTAKGHEVHSYLQTPFEEKEPVFSPNGRWVAYVSDASGRNEVYLQQFETGHQRTQISTDGGEEPAWGRTGRELFYRKGGKMMSVSVNANPELSVGKPAVLFSGLYTYNIVPNRDYDVGREGRFIMVEPDLTVNSRQINVVLDWSDQLKTKSRSTPE
jgi:eukaryotic-like serine/threonine-protein kinase